jgi:hypothetical protein
MTSNKMFYKRKKNIAWQMLDEKAVLVSPKEKRIHVLSGCGGSLWGHLKEEKSVEELVNLICEEFETSKDQAQDDIEKFLEELKSEDVIEIK